MMYSTTDLLEMLRAPKNYERETMATLKKILPDKKLVLTIEYILEGEYLRYLNLEPILDSLNEVGSAEVVDIRVEEVDGDASKP